MNTAIATTSSTVPATSSSSPSSTTLAQYPQEVLTLVMTVEYNGFAYAGFQRQTPTPRNHGVGLTSSMITNGGNGESRKRKKPGDDIIIISSGCKHNEKNNKNNPENGIGNSKGKTSSNKRTKVPTTSPQTIQDEIEKALQQWTNLSISTLRVRGAGRTDKGVHASGQVVAFDIPLRCLLLCDGDHDDDGADGGAASESGKSVSVGIKDVTNDNKKCYDINDNDDLEFEEKISSHALTLLRKAYSQKTKKSSNATTESSAQREGKQLKSKKQENDVIDQWETRRAIATRLARDIVIRSVWIWSGDHPFEPREGILCKTYTYNMRFRSLSYIGEDVELYGQQYQQQKQLEGVGKRDNNDIKRIIHPICHAGPCLLRRINDQNTVWLSSWPLDPTLLRKACHAFVGRHDFRNFVHKRERQKMVQEMEKNESRSSTTKTTTEENPFEIDLFEFTPYFQLEGTEEWITEVVPTAAHSAFLCLPSSTFSTPPIINVRFQLRAKGFKRSMVRMLVGFVVDVARGYTNLSDIPILLMEDGDENDVDVGVIRDAGGNRIGIVNTAPACGLSLAKVEYRHNNFL